IMESASQFDQSQPLSVGLRLCALQSSINNISSKCNNYELKKFGINTDSKTEKLRSISSILTGMVNREDVKLDLWQSIITLSPFFKKQHSAPEEKLEALKNQWHSIKEDYQKQTIDLRSRIEQLKIELLALPALPPCTSCTFFDLPVEIH